MLGHSALVREERSQSRGALDVHQRRGAVPQEESDHEDIPPQQIHPATRGHRGESRDYRRLRQLCGGGDARPFARVHPPREGDERRNNGAGVEETQTQGVEPVVGRGEEQRGGQPAP